MKKIFLVTAALVLIIAFATLTPSSPVCSWDFRGSLWGPSYMLLHGQTPYSLNTPYGPYPGIWMPQLIGAFFIVGLFPCWVAAKIWFISELAGLALMIWFVAGRKLPSPALFGLCLLLVFFFPPLYIHFVIGQISIFITVLLMLVVFLSCDEHSLLTLHWWAAVFLAIALAKPQLGVLVYPGLLVGMYRSRGSGASAKLVLLTAGWVLLLIVPVSLIDPGWPQGFLNITLGNVNVLWDLPTPLAQLRASMGSTGIVLWALLFLACLGFIVWVWLNRDARLALLWSLALTPIATPYCSSWDFMLMAPLLLWLLIHLQSRLARTALVLGALLVDILQVAMRWHTSISDGRNWWVPPAFLAVFILAVTLNQLFEKPGLLLAEKPLTTP